MNNPAIPQFTAELSLYQSSGYYVGTGSKFAAQGDGIVVPAAFFDRLRAAAYAVAEFLERHRDEACRAAAGTAGAGAAGACTAQNPANIVGCVSTGMAVTERAYNHCMAD
jgi:hypothetical protein